MHSGLNKVKASALRRWLSATKAYSRQPSHPFYGWGRLVLAELGVSTSGYIWTTEGFVYLASIMDLFSRKIIAWNLSRKLDASSIVRMIQMAKQTRNPGRLVVIHTDRGCQYLSQSYIKETAQMRRSYSKKGYPWDNACIESFHALIKREWLNRFKIENYQQAYCTDSIINT